MIEEATCLEKYVGLRGDCGEEGKVLFINDLPGVDMRTFAGTATEEDKTGVELFYRLRREAAIRVARDFKSAMIKKYHIQQVAERVVAGTVDSRNLVASGTFTVYRRHPELLLDLEKIRLYADREGEVVLSVSGAEPLTQQVVMGYNDLFVEGIPAADRLEVTIAGIDGLLVAAGYVTTCGCGTTGSISGRIVGEIVVASRCAAILCLFAEELAIATRYMTAVLLMEEVTVSQRKGFIVRNSKLSAEIIRARILGLENPDTQTKEPSLYFREIAMVVRDARLSGPCVTSTEAYIGEVIP